MFSHKKEYYLIIESTKDINLSNIKKRNRFIVIYRNKKNNEKFDQLLKFSGHPSQAGTNECSFRSHYQNNYYNILFGSEIAKRPTAGLGK